MDSLITIDPSFSNHIACLIYFSLFFVNARMYDMHTVLGAGGTKTLLPRNITSMSRDPVELRMR